MYLNCQISLCNFTNCILIADVDIVGLPPPLTYAHSMTLDPSDSSTDEPTVVYVMGGFTGGIQTKVTRINLPSDLCNLWNTQEKCRFVFLFTHSL